MVLKFRTEFTIPNGQPNAGEKRSFRVKVIDTLVEDGTTAWCECIIGNKDADWYSRSIVDEWYRNRVQLDALEHGTVEQYVEELGAL